MVSHKMTKNNALFLYGIAGLLLSYFLLKPINNWDVIGYLATFFWLEGFDATQVHNLTYSSLQASVSPERFTMLSEAGTYHSAVHAAPQALMAQVPFYATRVLLLMMVQGLNAIGIEPIQAFHLVNASAVTVLWVLMARWVSPVHKSSWWWLLLLFALAGALSIGRTVTPDATSALVAFSSIMVCVSKHRLAWLGPLLLPLARTDYVLLSGFICLWQFWQSKQLKWILVAALSGVIMLVVNQWAGHYGYRIIMQFTLLDAAAFPSQMPITWNFSDYPGFIWLGIRELASGTAIWLVVAALIYAKVRQLRFSSDEKSILCVVGLFFLMHFLVFPAGFQRFYVGCALLVLGAIWRAHVRKIRPQSVGEPNKDAGWEANK
jgi:hypothetical protein